MNTTELVVEIRPEKKIQARRGFEPMTFAILVQRSINGIAEVICSNRFFNRSAHI